MQFISFQLVLKLHENNGQMKRKLFFTFLFLCTISLSAKEGMWLPFLLEKMNEKEMKMMANPFTISISEIMIQTTNAKIESINKQISSQSRFQYVDRRDGSYTC